MTRAAVAAVPFDGIADPCTHDAGVRAIVGGQVFTRHCLLNRGHEEPFCQWSRWMPTGLFVTDDLGDNEI